MSRFKGAVIGTDGRERRAGRFGFAMAYRHADAYQALGMCDIAACADIVEERAQAFATAYGLPHVFVDYRQMLADVQPDIASICTWIHLHETMVLDACRAGVKAIHCEKSVADARSSAKQRSRPGCS